MWDHLSNGDTVGLERSVASCKEFTTQRSPTELAAVLTATGAACQALGPAAQGVFAGTEVFSLWAARLVGRPFGSKTKKIIPL